MTAFTSSGCGRMMHSYHMVEKMDWPIFKPLVLFLTAFNPSKPVALCVGRTVTCFSVVSLHHATGGNGTGSAVRDSAALWCRA